VIPEHESRFIPNTSPEEKVTEENPVKVELSVLIPVEIVGFDPEVIEEDEVGG